MPEKTKTKTKTFIPNGPGCFPPSPPIEGMTMRKPFAITLDVGSSRANHTGAWRTERPV